MKISKYREITSQKICALKKVVKLQKGFNLKNVFVTFTKATGALIYSPCFYFSFKRL